MLKVTFNKGFPGFSNVVCPMMSSDEDSPDVYSGRQAFCTEQEV
jgi:hypothetical protein